MAIEILRLPDDAGLLTLQPLRGRPVAVLGYGNQGRAHALNLRDSGVEVVVGSREESLGTATARGDGFVVQAIPDAAAGADLVILALPDEVQPRVYVEQIAPRLRPGATIGFIHGFNIHHRFIEPAPGIGVVMVAPKGPGTTLRELFRAGRGLPCLLAVERESAGDDASRLALAWATGIGAGRSAVIRTTFADETVSDLFGEQAVLCGGMTALVLAAFETLVEAGYPPELAYLECCHELKQVADLLYARGPSGMNEAISSTAEFGSFDAGPRLVDHNVRDRLRAMLADIRSGGFAERMRRDAAAGSPWLEARRRALRSHPIEPAGKVIRSLMPWLQEPTNGSDAPNP